MILDNFQSIEHRSVNFCSSYLALAVSLLAFFGTNCIGHKNEDSKEMTHLKYAALIYDAFSFRKFLYLMLLSTFCRNIAFLGPKTLLRVTRLMTMSLLFPCAL